MCKNNQTFSNDRSCSCRKVNHFLRRKGGYCQSSEYAGRGTCNESKMFPISISSSFVCVYKRRRLKPASSSVLVHLRAAGGQPSFSLCWNGLCHSIKQGRAGFDLSPVSFSITKLKATLRLQRSQGRSPSSTRRPGVEEQGFPADSSPSPQTEIIHKEPSDFIHLPTHEAFSRNPVLIKKYKELLLLSAREILYYCRRPDNWSHLKCIQHFKQKHHWLQEIPLVPPTPSSIPEMTLWWLQKHVSVLCCYEKNCTQKFFLFMNRHSLGYAHSLLTHK